MSRFLKLKPFFPLVTAGMLTALLATQATSGDWPIFLFDSTCSGFNSALYAGNRDGILYTFRK